MPHTVVHLMRHGEVHNPAGVLYGRLPGYHLSERGRAMARTVADHLVATGHDVTRVIASPLERAQETAAPVAAAFGLEVGTDPRLIEGGNAFEGRVVRADPASLAHPRNWPLYVNPLRPSWGEAYRTIAKRMADAVRSVLPDDEEAARSSSSPTSSRSGSPGSRSSAARSPTTRAAASARSPR
jgi:broad specificity phosphatase PhoE